MNVLALGLIGLVLIFGSFLIRPLPRWYIGTIIMIYGLGSVSAFIDGSTLVGVLYGIVAVMWLFNLLVDLR